MKAWIHSNSPSGHILDLRDLPLPVATNDEIVIRVRAASFNRGEFIAARNSPSAVDGKPAGIECAGEVVELGNGNTGFALGDKVMGRARMAFSEFAALHKGDAIAVPEGMSWEEAACASITYQVAHDMIFGEGGLQKEEWLLITGVTSGVGVAALQLGKLKGARVIGTSRKQERLEKLRKYGLDHGLVFLEDDFAGQIMEITDNYGVDLVVNTVGGGVFATCLSSLAYKGRMATVGHLDGIGQAEIDLKVQHRKRLKLFGVSTQLRTVQERTENVSLFTRDIVPAMRDRSVVPMIGEVVGFHDCLKGLDYMDSGSRVGKIVLASRPG